MLLIQFLDLILMAVVHHAGYGCTDHNGVFEDLLERKTESKARQATIVDTWHTEHRPDNDRSNVRCSVAYIHFGAGWSGSDLKFMEGNVFLEKC